jgi:hypothetical protein
LESQYRSFLSYPTITPASHITINHTNNNIHHLLIFIIT